MRHQYTFVCSRCGKQFESPHRNRKFCSRSCYVADRRAPKSPEVFWMRIDKSGGPDACWPWEKGTHSFGYGLVQFNNYNTTAQRIAWILTYGPIPAKMYVCHRCDNPVCCNPAHLFLGTHTANIADMVAKGRHSRGETKGTSKLTEDQVREIRRRYALGTATLHTLAEAYGVYESCISQIVNRKTWRHIS